MRHWNGWDAVIGLNQSKVTPSWCEKWNTAKVNFNPNHNPKHIVMTDLEPTTQSQPCKTIHYTNNEILEWLGCCEWLESVQSESILGVKRRRFLPELSPPKTQKPWRGDVST